MEVLHPERVLVLGGESVMVREYGNVEWLRALPVAEPLVAAITALLAGEQEPSYEVALDAIGRDPLTDDIAALGHQPGNEIGGVLTITGADRLQAGIQPVKFWFLFKGGTLQQKEKCNRAAEQAHAAERDGVHMQAL